MCQKQHQKGFQYPISNTEYPIINKNAKMNNATRKYDLEDRLIDYAVRIINVSEQLPESKAGKHIEGQLLRSGTAPAPNYGEAQSAESSKDYIHKIKIELRESKIWLKIIIRTIINPKISIRIFNRKE